MDWYGKKKKKKKESGYKSGPSDLVPSNIPGHVHRWSTACCSPDFSITHERLQFCLGLVISIFSRSVSGTYRSVASSSVSFFLLLLRFSFSSHHSFSRWLLFWTRSYLSIYYFTHLPPTYLYIYPSLLLSDYRHYYPDLSASFLEMKNSIPSDVWEKKRALIAKLYKDEEWPLKQVIKQIRAEDFNPR